MKVNDIDVGMESRTQHDLGAKCSAGNKKTQLRLVDNRYGETKVCEGESTLNLMKHIEKQYWPNMIVDKVAGRGRVVLATQIIKQGMYVCM